jgi:hypothetical protein
MWTRLCGQKALKHLKFIKCWHNGFAVLGGFVCSMITRVRILWQLLMKHQAAGIWSPHMLVGRPISSGLSCAWTTTWSLAWTKFGQWWQRAWSIQGFDHNWKPPLQTVSRLVNCNTICIEKRGDYTEKWCTLHLSQIFIQEVSNTITLPFDSTS